MLLSLIVTLILSLLSLVVTTITSNNVEIK